MPKQTAKNADVWNEALVSRSLHMMGLVRMVITFELYMRWISNGIRAAKSNYIVLVALQHSRKLNAKCINLKMLTVCGIRMCCAFGIGNTYETCGHQKMFTNEQREWCQFKTDWFYRKKVRSTVHYNGISE